VSLSLYLIFPVSLLSGIIFTMLGKALHSEMGTETKAAGLLTMANTTGGMVGSLIAGFVFVPYIGVETSFFLFALCYGLIALLVYQRRQVPRREGKRKLSLLHAAVGAFVISLLLFPFGFMEDIYLKIPFERYNKSGEERVSVREGVTETLQYLQKDLLGRPLYHRLVTNSHSMSGTWLNARRYMKAFVYWPAAVHPNLKNALLLCYGCGMTAKALTDTDTLESIEVVDISRDIIEESKVVFPDREDNPIYDPRVKVHIEDGRFFLLTRQRRFDLITAEPPPPKFKGIVNLYSREFFQLIHDRLADGGIVTYWLPVYQMSVSEAKSVLKAFSEVFPDCSLWAGAGLEWMMAAVKNPGRRVTVEEFSRRWNDPVVGREVRTLGFTDPEQLGAFFIADGRRLEQWTAEALPLVDNYPKRMSPHFPTFPLGADAENYVGFMNHPGAAANFMNSPTIKKIWPESMRKNAEKHFAAVRIINEILTPSVVWNRHKKIYYLHRCLHDSLLDDYIPWVLGSNQQAQNIIAMFREQNPGRAVQGPDTYTHLAAGALLKRNYILAEHYLRLVVYYLSGRDLLTDRSRFNYCTLRMYLLFMGGDRIQARRVGEEFLEQLEKKQGKENRDKMAVQFKNYLQWLDKIIDEKTRTP
jgi:spermidine synthase